MGRTPAEIAEIAEGAEVYWEGGKETYIGAVFNNCLGQLNRYHGKQPQKSRLQSMEPTHPDRLVENVTAPSAGGFPGPDGEVRLRMRLPFRTGSS